jgi:predicted DsbA family dithiol-disulfide isomerase
MELETKPRLTLPVGERDHVKHSLEAPVVLVEYGDYECPHCQEVYPILHELKEQMGDRVAYVYRHFPISRQHPSAQLAAEAAEAAAAQGKFWEMHHRLFTHQNELAFDDLLVHARAIGLDEDTFRRALDEHTYAGRVREDFMSGVRSGVNGTPTFYVNGARYDGAWDYESLLEAIEKPLGVQISLLAQEFTRLAASGGIVLLLAFKQIQHCNFIWVFKEYSLVVFQLNICRVTAKVSLATSMISLPAICQSNEYKAIPPIPRRITINGNIQITPIKYLTKSSLKT